jgi:hypothetical protein
LNKGELVRIYVTGVANMFIVHIHLQRESRVAGGEGLRAVCHDCQGQYVRLGVGVYAVLSITESTALEDFLDQT